MNLQPLRIEAGWLVKYNQLYEVDPVTGFEDYFEGSSLLMLVNISRLKIIDVEWRPERDLNGKYKLVVLNFVENFNPKANEFDSNPDWENPYLIFSTASRLELVKKLEELMRTLPAHEDQRITVKRGLISEPSESYRLKLKEGGVTNELVKSILENGNAKIQNILLNHKDITREIVMEFYKNGITQKVRNKAKQHLNSKRFIE